MPQKITIVTAMTHNQVIGKNNSLPWHCTEDLKHFKRYTYGKPLVMGRRTFESIGKRPLPGRPHVILTHDPQYVADGCHISHHLQDALKLWPNEPEIIIAGGAALYQAALPIATHLVISWIDLQIDGDTFFPEVDWSTFKMTMQTEPSEHCTPYFTINHYTRIDLYENSQ